MKMFQSKATCMYGKKIYFSTAGGIVNKIYAYDPEYCYHDFIELELHMKGSGVHYMNAIPYDVRPGYFFLLMPGDFHKYGLKMNADFFLYNIKIDTHYLNDEIMKKLIDMPRPLAVYLSDELINLIEKEMLLLQTMCTNSPRNEIYIKNITERIVILLIEEIKKKGHFSSSFKEDCYKQHKNIESITSYVESHYTENLTAEKMADLINVSPHYFSSYFMVNTGMTFKKFLTRVRLFNATILLETTNLSIKEISYKVGFSSQAYFSRVFTNFFGQSPQIYKKQI